MAIAATGTVFATVHRISVHAGGIGLNGANGVDAWRCRLPGTMADPAGLSLTAGVHWRRWLARQGHGMYFAMTIRTGGKLHAGDALHTLRPMHAHYLFVDKLAMTTRTIDRVEPTPVTALCADVTIETLRRTVRGGRKECHIDFVAIVTRVLLLGVDGL